MVIGEAERVHATELTKSTNKRWYSVSLRLCRSCKYKFLAASSGHERRWSMHLITWPSIVLTAGGIRPRMPRRSRSLYEKARDLFQRGSCRISMPLFLVRNGFGYFLRIARPRTLFTTSFVNILFPRNIVVKLVLYVVREGGNDARKELEILGATAEK